MKKLTDVELSRVLSVSAVGQLNYYDCCLAMSALAITDMPGDFGGRAWELSRESSSMGEGDDCIKNGDPDATLRVLESRGLA